MSELNLLYERQRQQYQVARQNVQIINKRCHELKVQIANLRKLSPEEVPQERIDEAECAARLYDANRNTGNEVLDVVLTEKSLLCESRGIQLNAVANGSCLGFLKRGICTHCLPMRWITPWKAPCRSPGQSAGSSICWSVYGRVLWW